MCSMKRIWGEFIWMLHNFVFAKDHDDDGKWVLEIITFDIIVCEISTYLKNLYLANWAKFK